MATERAPKTLREAIIFFADYENCRRAVEAIRWPDGVVTCPTCGSERVTYLATQRRYKCYGKHPKAQFSLKVGTIFEDSAVGFDKWLPALWLLTNCKNGISSYELARALGVTQKTAWFMLARLRMALHAGHDGRKMKGAVEADETYIGGKARNMHLGKRRRLKMTQGRSVAGKVAVMACSTDTAAMASRRSAPPCSITSVRPALRATSANTSRKAAQPSTPMRSSPTSDWTRATRTGSLTMRKPTWTAKSTPTASRTSEAS